MGVIARQQGCESRRIDNDHGTVVQQAGPARAKPRLAPANHEDAAAPQTDTSMDFSREPDRAALRPHPAIATEATAWPNRGPGAREALRAATRAHHDAMERAPVMAALLGPSPGRDAVACAIAGQLAVIGPIEAALDRHRADLAGLFDGYVSRAPLARVDLARLGATPLAKPSHGPIALDTAEAWLGFRYVMEGSSLGGALITRKLAASALPPLGFFDPHGEGRGAAWRRFCALLDSRLPDGDRRAAAARAAGAVFDAIGKVLGAPSR